MLNGCMALDFSADPIVIEQPESKYAQETEYKCRRCGKSFSERMPTARRVNANECIFDKGE